MEPHKHSKSGSVLSPSNVWQFCLLAASSGVYVSIILYARSTDRAEAASEAGRPLTPFLKVGVGTTLTVVRVLQGILSAASAVALTRAMASLQWGLMAKPGGIPFRSLLALSTSTLDYGTARIIFSRSSEFVTRLEGAGRYEGLSICK
jgi:hypothetical protein